MWRWKNSIICLRLTLEILHKIFWVSLGVLFKDLGVQKDTQTPCWLRLCRTPKKCLMADTFPGNLITFLSSLFLFVGEDDRWLKVGYRLEFPPLLPPPLLLVLPLPLSASSKDRAIAGNIQHTNIGSQSHQWLSNQWKNTTHKYRITISSNSASSKDRAIAENIYHRDGYF